MCVHVCANSHNRLREHRRVLQKKRKLTGFSGRVCGGGRWRDALCGSESPCLREGNAHRGLSHARLCASVLARVERTEGAERSWYLPALLFIMACVVMPDEADGLAGSESTAYRVMGRPDLTAIRGSGSPTQSGLEDKKQWQSGGILIRCGLATQGRETTPRPYDSRYGCMTRTTATSELRQGQPIENVLGAMLRMVRSYKLIRAKA